MKYQLIKYYPGSPELGTILERGYTGYVPDGQSKSLGSWFVSKDHVENNPEFWKPISEDKQLTTEHIKDFINIQSYRSGTKGGQHVNRGESGVMLDCQEFNFRMEFHYYRSSYQNREVCLQCLQLFLDTLPNQTKNYYIELYQQRRISEEKL